MKRLLPLFILAGVFALVFGLQFYWDSAPAPDAPAVTPARAAAPAPGYLRYQAVVAAPRARRRPPEAGYDRPCESFWDSLRGQDLARAFAFPPTDFSLPSTARCRRVPPALRAFHERYEQACRDVGQRAADVTDPEHWRQEAGNCYLAAMLYRANLSEWLTQGVDLRSLNDPGLLADKMVAHFFQNPGESARIAERLLEIEPELYPAAQAALLGHLMEARQTGRGWEKFEDALGRAREMNPAAAVDLAETEMVAAISRARDARDVRTRAESLEDRFPGTGLSEYFLAWVEYKQGDRERALKYLKESCRLRPQARCEDTRARVERGEADAFQASLQLPLDFLAPTLP